MVSDTQRTATKRVLIALATGGTVGLLLWVTWPRQAPTIAANADSSLTLAASRLNAVAEKLRRSPGPGNARQTLVELGEFLSTLPPQAASAVIQDFLRRGVDAPTGLAFELKADGFLKNWPTLRLFFLDRLAEVDPAASAAYAKEVLQSLDFPDEWAVCLRIVARADASGPTRTFLQEKIEKMLGHEPWQQNPSAGFLEAFDVAVYLGGTKLMPVLTDFLRRTNNEALAQAAYLALDRLTIRDPSATLGALQAAPESMQGREVTRANYFARADVREVRQRQVLEGYLLSPERLGAELQAFAGIYPNANLMVSHNLLTPVNSPGQADLLSRDIAALQVAQEWLRDPRFERLKPYLEKVRIRLEMFVEQAHLGQ